MYPQPSPARCMARHRHDAAAVTDQSPVCEHARSPVIKRTRGRSRRAIVSKMATKAFLSRDAGTSPRKRGLTLFEEVSKACPSWLERTGVRVSTGHDGYG